MNQQGLLSKSVEIEVLRAAAILFVLAAHLPIITSGWSFDPSRHVEMWAGVDLFFVISGFLITRSLFPLLDKRFRGEAWLPELKVFWLKRVFRLLPGAWLWLLVPILLSLIWGEHPLFAPTRTLLNDGLAALAQVANLYWAQCLASNQWGTLCSKPPLLGPYWSLSLEEQFYLLLPLFFLVCPRRMLLAVLLGLILLLLFWDRPIFSLAWYLRPDGLLWGVVLGLLSRRSGYAGLAPRWLIQGRGRSTVPLLLIGLLAVMPALLPNGFYLFSTTGVVSVIAAVLLFLASQGSGFAPSGRWTRVLLWFGSRSDALYLVHFPLYSLVLVLLFPNRTEVLSQPSAALFYGLLTGVVVAMAAELTYRWVETPARDYGRQLARRIAQAAAAHEGDAKNEWRPV